VVEIFLKQIPIFLSNLHRYLETKDNKQLAKEAHTAKSSVLVFMMEDTSKRLKQIQLLAEKNTLEEIPPLLEEISSELHQAIPELRQFLKETK
jgi:HPt (histidine-containing phosphotransfer) domain-containing protein